MIVMTFLARIRLATLIMMLLGIVVSDPAIAQKLNRKRYELPHPPGGYDRVLKRVGIQY
jgi:hypothetical protein